MVVAGGDHWLCLLMVSVVVGDIWRYLLVMMLAGDNHWLGMHILVILMVILVVLGSGDSWLCLLGLGMLVVRGGRW